MSFHKVARSIYLLTHTPVHIGRPLQVGFVQKAPWSDALFQKYQEGVEENRKAQCGRRYLSKRDIERWGFFPPCGARFEVIEVDLTWVPSDSTEAPPASPDTEFPALDTIYKAKEPGMPCGHEVLREPTPEMR